MRATPWRSRHCSPPRCDERSSMPPQNSRVEPDQCVDHRCLVGSGGVFLAPGRICERAALDAKGSSRRSCAEPGGPFGRDSGGASSHQPAGSRRAAGAEATEATAHAADARTARRGGGDHRQHLLVDASGAGAAAGHRLGQWTDRGGRDRHRDQVRRPHRRDPGRRGRHGEGRPGRSPGWIPAISKPRSARPRRRSARPQRTLDEANADLEQQRRRRSTLARAGACSAPRILVPRGYATQELLDTSASSR